MDSKYIGHVFPLIICSFDGKTFGAEQNFGTGFLIGKNGYALTAKHVFIQIDQAIKSDQKIVGLFVEDSGNRIGFEILAKEFHETEDVAIFKIEMTKKYDSVFKINKGHIPTSFEYASMGYPHSVAEHIKYLYPEFKPTPDLVYTTGYIRRRFTHELPSVQFQGSHFFEISEVVGEGYSGSPVYLKPNPYSDSEPNSKQTIGIYLGTCDAANAGYAVRADSFADWKPQLLKGKSIIEESN